MDLRRLNQHLEGLLVEAGAPRLDGWYFCPHHPAATLPAYRVDCECRKPRPGMLRQAARDLWLDLTASFMVGDRLTDVAAGVRAGCRTALVETGRHAAPPIETVEPVDPAVRPDAVCADLSAAVDWILRKR
jgi:D-glycero-D-manno-heptose 1,7-bisphosphate phosphatase